MMLENSSEELPFVSVVVCTYNRRGMLEECLESLFSQSYPKNKYEIIVVDSSDDANETIGKKYEEKSPVKLKYIIQKPPKGIAAARNLGIEKASGEIVCFIDDDCIADRCWIAGLVSFFSDKNVGGVGGRITPYKSNLLLEKYTNTIEEHNQAKFFYSKKYIITANAAYRKKILQIVGGFDVNLKAFEDVDISIRIQLKGFKLKYNPDAVVYHRHLTTLKGLIKQQYFRGIGLANLSKKYPERYNSTRYLLRLFLKIAYKLAIYPVTILGIVLREDKILYASKPLLDVLVSVSNILGIVKGSISRTCIS